MITDNGLVKPTFTDLKLQYIQQLRDAFETDPNQPKLNVASNTPLGHLIDLRAKEMADVWDVIEFIYNAIDLDSASGLQLDIIGKIKNVIRIEGIPAMVRFTFYQEFGKSATVLAGVNITDVNQGIVYETDGVTSILENPTNYNEVMLQLDLSEPGQADFGFEINTTGAGRQRFMTNMNSNNPEGILRDIAASLTNQWEYGTATVLSFPPSAARVDDPKWNLKPLKPGEYRISLRSLNHFTILGSKRFTILYTGYNAWAHATAISNLATDIMNDWGGAKNTLGVFGVLNRSPGEPGTIIESDTDYRERLDSLGNNLIFYSDQAIRNTIMRTVPNVTHVAVTSNRSDMPRKDVTPTMPGHSVAIVVQGGDEQAIASAIAVSAPPGITLVGGTEIIVPIEVQNTIGEHDVVVRFGRPSPVYLYLKVEYSLQLDETLPDNGENLMRAAILDWAREEYVAGRDVILSRIFTPINTLRGIKNIRIGAYIERETDAMNPGNTDIDTIAPSDWTYFPDSNNALTLAAHEYALLTDRRLSINIQSTTGE